MSIGIAAAALLGAQGCGTAEPPQAAPVTTPQAQTPCSENLAGAMARLEDGEADVMCTGHGDGYEWTVSSSSYPVSGRWLTYGTELQLHGQGMRNPGIMSGNWTGYPQESNAVCQARQVTAMGREGIAPAERGS